MKIDTILKVTNKLLRAKIKSIKTKKQWMNGVKMNMASKEWLKKLKIEAYAKAKIYLEGKTNKK